MKKYVQAALYFVNGPDKHALSLLIYRPIGTLFSMFSPAEEILNWRLILLD